MKRKAPAPGRSGARADRLSAVDGHLQLNPPAHRSQPLSVAAHALARGDVGSWARASRDAARAFGTLNGWVLTELRFLPSDIRRRSPSGWPVEDDLFDHALYFRADGRCAAIVCQPYDDPTREGATLALRLGLRWSMPPRLRASFHNPGRCFFGVLHACQHVRWLDEQK